MNADHSGPEEERFTTLLIACDEALAAGVPAPPLAETNAAPGLQPRLERGVRCLRLLEKYWPSRGLGDSTFPAGPFVTPAEQRPDGPPTRFGRFHICGELGHGSFGTVYLAHDPLLGRAVALKIPRVPALATSEVRQRFHHEAQAAARLDHPNLVPVYEAGAIGDVCYLASAYCPGTTLAAWLHQCDEPVPWRVTANLVATLADAVQHAHSRGVLHRDLKPANVLLQKDEGGRMKDEIRRDLSSDSSFILHPSSFTPKVADFGLAKLLIAGQPDQTGSGMILGSPCYMAPEQADAKNREITTAADVYGLGAILYELLTKRPPFQADTVLGTLEQVRSAAPDPPRRRYPGVPRDLETICLKCLQKDPRRRYASAHGLAGDLRRLLAGEPIHARAVGAAERLWKWAQRRPAAAAVAGVTCLAVGLCIVLSVAFNVRLAQEKDATDLALQNVEQEKQATEQALQREVQSNIDLKRALDRERQALYFHRVSLAHHEWLANNVARAAELLDACPAELRQWEWRYLKRLGQHGFATLTGHHCEVSYVAVDTKGKRLASASWDWTVKVWDVATQKKVCTLRGHKDFVDTVAFSPDGQRVASASRDKRVLVWDIATGKVCYTLPHPLAVASVAFSPDGTRLASASWDHNVRLWDAATGKLQRTLGPHPGRLFCVAFSPDGRRLAAGSSDVRLWNADTGARIGAPLTADAVDPLIWVGGVAFHPDGRLLASANGNKTVYLWDTVTRKPLHVLRGHSSGVNSVHFSPDGKRLASAAYDQAVRLWDTASGAELHILRGHTAPWVSSVAFAPDGRRLASAGGDRTVRMWDALDGQEVRTIPGGSHLALAPSRDGRLLATASHYSGQPVVVVWELPSMREVVRLRGHTIRASTVAFHPDGRSLASAGDDKLVKIWDTQTWKESATLRGHTQPIRHVAYSRDGRRLASAGMDGTVRIWDAATGKAIRLLKGHTHWVTRVAFSPDGNTLASASADATIRLWNAATGETIHMLPGHRQGATALAFDATGKRLASGGRDGTVKQWDAATGKMAFAARGHTAPVLDVVFAPDGRRIASGSDDYTVKLWDAATGAEALTLRGHIGSVNSVAFDASGTRLFGGGAGMKIWEALPAADR
jgi:WD40 repeat protein